MDTHTIKMPDIGEGIAEVEIVEWHVAVGDSVAEDQVLADVMTDKASVEIPSPIAGTVQSLGGNVGDILAVGSDLITIAPASGVGVSSTEDAADESDSSQRPATQPSTGTPARGDAAGQSAELAAATKEVSQPDATLPTQTKSKTATSPSAGTAASAGAASRTTEAAHKKVLASPSVRHRARQLDIDLSVLAHDGDAPVSHRDLDNYLLSQHRGAVSAPNTSSTAGAPGQTRNADIRADQQVNIVGMRRQIAQKMQESKRQIPHFSYVEELDITELEALRQALNSDSLEGEARLTLLPFIARAMVLAVRRYPEVNARYDDHNGVVTHYGAVHLGIATQTDRGLMVPVLRDADQMDIRHCASQISSLASAARRGKASREQLAGSTITLSSLGAMGGVVSTPIINYPEVAIVGVNRIVERMVVKGGLPVLRKTMNLSSSFDHRVIDGMLAAQFIQEVRRLLECPALLFVDGHP